VTNSTDYASRFAANVQSPLGPFRNHKSQIKIGFTLIELLVVIAIIANRRA